MRESKCYERESIGSILTAIEIHRRFVFRVRFPASKITSALRVTRLRTGIIPHGGTVPGEA